MRELTTRPPMAMTPVPRLHLPVLASTAHGAARVSVLVVVIVIAGWFVVLVVALPDLTLPSESRLMTLQVLAAVGTVSMGATGAADALLVLRDRHGFWSIIGAMALVLAALVVIWVALVFNLLKFDVSYWGADR